MRLNHKTHRFVSTHAMGHRIPIKWKDETQECNARGSRRSGKNLRGRKKRCRPAIFLLMKFDGRGVLNFSGVIVEGFMGFSLFRSGWSAVFSTVTFMEFCVEVFFRIARTKSSSLG